MGARVILYRFRTHINIDGYEYKKEAWARTVYAQKQAQKVDTHAGTLARELRVTCNGNRRVQRYSWVNRL